MRITEYSMQLNEERNPILVKEKSKNYQSEKHLNSPEAICRMMHDCFQMDNLAEEHLYIISLNNKLMPNGIFEVSHGSINGSVVDNKAIFSRLMLVGGNYFVVLHNHPSGIAEPSQDDFNATEKITNAGKILDIQLMDHIVVGKNQYYSIMSRQYGTY